MFCEWTWIVTFFTTSKSQRSMGVSVFFVQMERCISSVLWKMICRKRIEERCSQLLGFKIAFPSNNPQVPDPVELLYFSCQQSEPHFVLPSSACLVNQSSIASASIWVWVCLHAWLGKQQLEKQDVRGGRGAGWLAGTTAFCQIQLLEWWHLKTLLRRRRTTVEVWWKEFRDAGWILSELCLQNRMWSLRGSSGSAANAAIKSIRGWNRNVTTSMKHSSK